MNKNNGSVFRVIKNKNYTVMSNYHLSDTNISLKAIGLLSKMLSLPDKWDYSISGLIAICKENETAVKNTLKELKDYGYLQINKTKNTKGYFEYEYIISEYPQGKNLNIDNPDMENPPMDNLNMENQGQLNTNKLNTKKLSTKELNTYSLLEREKNEKFSNSFQEDLLIEEEKTKPTKKVDIYLNEYKVYFEQEYEKVFGRKPFLSKFDCEKIVELSSMYEKEIIKQAIEKLKEIRFKDINFKPTATWLLKENNFERVMNGEFDKQEPIEYEFEY